MQRQLEPVRLASISSVPGARRGHAIVLGDREAFNKPQLIRQIIEARRLRGEIFGAELFADPAWDLLLELYLAHLEQRRLSVSALFKAGGQPATTNLRWLAKLERDGLAERVNDKLDARRIWVSLSPKGVDAMKRYFDEAAITTD